MNKLFVSPNLLEDEKLNSKIERIFENQLFQKMVENANVLEEAGVASQSGSRRDASEEVDMMNILDSKLIQKSELLNPYDEEKEMDLIKDKVVVLEDEDSQELERRKKEHEKKKGMLRVTSTKDMHKNMQKEKLKEIYSDKKKNKEKEEEKDASPLKEANEEEELIITKNFEKAMSDDLERFSDIESYGGEDSQFIQPSSSFISEIENPDFEDEYDNDDDLGFELYQVEEEEVLKVCHHLAEEFDFPARAVNPKYKKKPKTKPEPKLSDAEKKMRKERGYIYLPEEVKHPSNDDEFYPVADNKTIYDCFDLKVIYDRERTGFEETKEFPIIIGSIIAGRYRVMEYLGSAAFSKAIQCQDLITGDHYCMKVIENNKDYFDQSIDEIKLLKFININGDVDKKNVLRLFDYFYHKVSFNKIKIIRNIFSL